jgi:hypothetical protein
MQQVRNAQKYDRREACLHHTNVMSFRPTDRFTVRNYNHYLMNQAEPQKLADDYSVSARNSREKQTMKQTFSVRRIEISREI